MTELKTLKDIEIADRYNLRKEAIKWVKHWKRLNNDVEGIVKEKDFPEIIYRDGFIRIFKHFFNLIEKDLKN